MEQRLYVDMREMRLLGFELNQSQFKPGDKVKAGCSVLARYRRKEDA